MNLLQTAKRLMSPVKQGEAEVRAPAAYADPAIEEADLKAEAGRHWDEKRMTGEDDPERYQRV
jgi:hypothetical protein